MKSKLTIDLSIFNSILRELKSIRKELKSIKGEPERKPVAKRKLSDPITTADVLRILKITPATLNKYEKLGFIHFHKEGRSKIYSETEVRAFRKAKGRSKRVGKNVLLKLKED